MREHRVKMPTLGLIAGTRVALGMGIGLLVADRLSNERRQACGWTLAAIGALSTIPLAMEVLRDRPTVEAPSARRKLRHDRKGRFATNSRRAAAGAS